MQRVPGALIDTLRQKIGETRKSLAAWASTLPPARGQALVKAHSDFLDEVIGEVEAAARALVPAPEVILVALGGYGRAELCPRSDVDLLFLWSDATEEHRAFVDAVLYGLWDLGLELGHATRTASECLQLAKADQSALSALLDARALHSEDQGQVTALLDSLDHQLFSGERARRFIDAKLQEAQRRQARFSDTVFLLEPNIKESGLRALHTALWIARARWRTRGLLQLSKRGVLSARETQTLERAYGFLLRVRSELHWAAQRRQDVLLFQYQEAIAVSLGYVRPGERDLDKKAHGVERFMRAYYFSANQLRHLARLVVERATEKESSPAPAPHGFWIRNDTLMLPGRQTLAEDPRTLVRIFRVAQEESLPLYSYTQTLLAEERVRLDRGLRRDPQVVGDFLALLEDPKGDATILEVMNDLGILRRLIPEWSRVTAHWQHSLYHVYTVDVHSIFVVEALKALRLGRHADEQRTLTRLIAELPRPAVLYLAALLHDIGKGWPRGDHSRRGAKIAAVIGARLEAAGLLAWTQRETTDLVWLVRQHLLMSDLSQRRDLSDPSLMAQLAAEAGTRERLAMLHLLTWADLTATSPKVWTDWKGSLLQQLYEQTEQCLVGQSNALFIEARRTRLIDELRALGGAPVLVQSFVERLPERYLLTFAPQRMLRHLAMWNDLNHGARLAIHVRHLRREGTTKLTVASPDRPGLLALLAGTLAAHRLQILSAHIFSVALVPGLAEAGLGTETDATYFVVPGDTPPATTGALDVLYLTGEDGQLMDDPGRWAQVMKDLQAVLLNGKDLRTLLPRSALEPRPRPFVRTEIQPHPDLSATETIVDVFCPDRLGVLYQIARTFGAHGLSIRLAKISTQGDRVADGFYVTDLAGQKVNPEQLAVVVKALEQALTGV